MAHLVRITIVRHLDPVTGRRVPAGTSGAVIKSVQSRKFYGQGIPGQPPTKRVPLAGDKATAQRMLDNIVRDAERGAADLPDADAARLPLATLLAEFEADMLLGLASRARASKRVPSTDQVTLTVQRIRDILAGCKFTAVASLNASAPAKLAKYLARRVALARKDGGFSSQSAEFYRMAAKRFAWWLSVRRRCPVRPDLFDDVPSHDAEGNRVHGRRAILPVELAALLGTTRVSKRRRRKLAGEDRYSVYLLALTTGFRANELARLERTSFLLDFDPPIVQLRSRPGTKSTRGARQPVPVSVANHFREYLEKRPAKGPIWPGDWANKTADILRDDLKEAGVDYRFDGGDGDLFLDFHALRHSYISALAAAGVGPKELQVLARHTDPTLTLGIYTHATAGNLSGAVERIALPANGEEQGGIPSMSRAELETAVAVLMGVVRTLAGK
jgi:integrase